MGTCKLAATGGEIGIGVGGKGGYGALRLVVLRGQKVRNEGGRKPETKGEAFKGGSLPWRLKPMGTRRQGEDPSFIEPISFVAWRTPFRIRYCPGLTKIGGFRPESGIARG